MRGRASPVFFYVKPGIRQLYMFVGIERNTKLVLAWHLGQRDMTDTEVFHREAKRGVEPRWGHKEMSMPPIAIERMQQFIRRHTNKTSSN